MRGYTLDTNIVTAYLKRHPLVRQRIRQAESAGHPVMLNAVSYYETKRGLLFADAQTQMRLFEQLWRAQGIVMLDQAALDSFGLLHIAINCVKLLIAWGFRDTQAHFVVTVVPSYWSFPVI